MALTWAQKKAGITEIIETYYAKPLRDTGFVSYKGEGFHWYKVKDELLYKVHLPLFSPAGALHIVPLVWCNTPVYMGTDRAAQTAQRLDLGHDERK